jgi:hypothetical protein
MEVVVGTPVLCPKAVVRSLDLSRLYRRLAKEDALETEERAALATKQYKRFLVLTFKHQDVRVVPFSSAVLKVWTRHMLDTREYMDDCAELGASANAAPGVIRCASSAPLASSHYAHRCAFRTERSRAAAIAKTEELYAVEFGEALPAAPLDGGAGFSRACASCFAVVASSALGRVEAAVAAEEAAEEASKVCTTDGGASSLARATDAARLAWLPRAVLRSVADRPAVSAKINVALLAVEPAAALREYARYLQLVVAGLSGTGDGIESAVRELLPASEVALVERAALDGANAVLDVAVGAAETKSVAEAEARGEAVESSVSMKDMAQMQFTPSKTVDELWHAHICASFQYAAFCRAVNPFAELEQR